MVKVDPSGGGNLEIHKPKPWHGWREFLKEYLIIVVGVLTALAGEQVVEAVHHSSEAIEAHEAIRAELVANITRIEQRDFAHDCVLARLNQLSALIAASGPDGRLAQPISWIGRPPRYAVETARWDAASQSGRVSLLPPSTQSRLGFLYTTLRYEYGLNNDEQQTWSKLDGLTGLDRLTPDGKLAMKGEIEQARFYNGSLHQIAQMILNRAGAEGLRPTKRRDPPWTICWPATTSGAEARARFTGSGSVFGNQF